MPRVNMVKSARKARPAYGIEVGDTYYWWKFRFGGTRFSKTYPKRSQLTQSSFLSTLYDLEDGIAEYTAEDIEDNVTSLIDDLNNLKDECQESLDNMPEHLQESSASGETLQERIDGLDEWISSLESLDFDDLKEALEAKDEDLIEEKFSDILSEVESANPGIG